MHVRNKKQLEQRLPPRYFTIDAHSVVCMKKTAVLAGIFSILLVSALVIAGCELLTNTDTDVTGTWTGTINSHSATLEVTSSGWYLSVPRARIDESGTYTLSGNTATLMASGLFGSTITIGTATVNGNTMTFLLYENTGYGGTYDLTRNGSRGGTSVPRVPTGVTAAALSSSSISVSWNPVSGATRYKVYYEKDSSSIKILADTVTGTSYTHTGLQANTDYYYYITAVNNAGESSFSYYGFATTSSSGGGTSAPGTPTGVTAMALSSNSISVSWNSVSGATSYLVYYEIGSSYTRYPAGTVTGTSYTHTGLQANMAYYYCITAVNSAGESGYSSYGSATTFSSGGGTIDVTGTWTGTVQSHSATVVVNSSGWYLSIPTTGIYESGTYTLNGNTATLWVFGYDIGTATVSGNNMMLVLNNYSDYPGTYYLTKGGGTTTVTGTWTGMVSGYVATVVVNSSGWSLIVPGTDVYEYGTYTLSGNTAALLVSGYDIGTATVSGNNMTLVLNNYSDYPGTYYLTKQ